MFIFDAVANCDRIMFASPAESRNMKVSGNLFRLRLTASLRRFVGTPYNAAKSESSMTFCPRTRWILWSIRAGTPGFFFTPRIPFLWLLEQAGHEERPSPPQTMAAGCRKVNRKTAGPPQPANLEGGFANHEARKGFMGGGAAALRRGRKIYFQSLTIF
jgi:hypothetical protein